MIVTEFAKFDPLNPWIERKCSINDLSMSINFVRDIVRGLHYLHTWSTVHCDLKSHNILIADGYKAKLTDFGITETTPWRKGDRYNCSEYQS